MASGSRTAFYIVTVIQILSWGASGFKLDGSKAIITGDNLIFAYERDGADYLFQGAQANDATESRNLYYFELTAGKATIRVSGGNYLYVNPNEALSTTPSEAEATEFGVLPIIGSDRFNLYYSFAPGDDYFLVTPNARAPFTFYLSRRYPDEPRALFHLREVTVEEAYANDRNNINQTLSLIHTSPNLDKAVAYAQLLSLMETNGHLEGADIFNVANSVVADFGINNDVFSTLPAPVQLIFQGIGVKLFYRDFPMKYSWASDLHTDIKPYTFSRDEQTGLWAITYSTDIQLSTAYLEPLVDIPTDEMKFIFQLNYWTNSTEPASIELKCYSSTDSKFHTVITTETEPDFYFKCDDVAGGYKFTLAEA